MSGDASSIAAERPFTTGLAEGDLAGKLGMIVIEEMPSCRD
jgi:hypothetical protein